ncbi:MAG: energy transducer TonB [Bacteroidaceae bacterium]|jgi:protein TonB
MANSDLSSKEWCELVFESKNKAYGAYDLRKNLAHRNLVALIITIVIAALVVILPLVVSLMPEEEVIDEANLEVTELATLEEAEVKDENLVKKVDLAPPPPPLRSSIKFVPPIIAKDNEVSDADEMKSQDELTSSKVAISIADVKGNDDIHGMDIADVKQVVVQAAPKKVEEDKIYETVEQRAEFPGGMKALYKWLSENMVFPQPSIENGVQGNVVVRFVVGKDGRITDATIIKSLDPFCDKEAIRCIKAMPRWTPGKMNGVAVRSYYVLPIQFTYE